MPVLGLPADAPLGAWPHSGRIAILDLEFTSWQGSWERDWKEPWEWREVVQIGLLVTDASRNFLPLAGAEVLVTPRRNPQLSEYFQGLTGITQADLAAEGVSLKEGLAQLEVCMARADCVIFNGLDGQILRENCQLEGINFPWQGIEMYNFRPLLANTLGLTSDALVSGALPGLAGLENTGRAHTALDDCRAIAAALAAWREARRL